MYHVGQYVWGWSDSWYSVSSSVWMLRCPRGRSALPHLWRVSIIALFLLLVSHSVLIYDRAYRLYSFSFSLSSRALHGPNSPIVGANCIVIMGSPIPSTGRLVFCHFWINEKWRVNFNVSLWSADTGYWGAVLLAAPVYFVLVLYSVFVYNKAYRLFYFSFSLPSLTLEGPVSQARVWWSRRCRWSKKDM